MGPCDYSNTSSTNMWPHLPMVASIARRYRWWVRTYLGDLSLWQQPLSSCWWLHKYYASRARAKEQFQIVLRPLEWCWNSRTQCTIKTMNEFASFPALDANRSDSFVAERLRWIRIALWLIITKKKYNITQTIFFLVL